MNFQFWENQNKPFYLCNLLSVKTSKLLVKFQAVATDKREAIWCANAKKTNFFILSILILFLFQFGSLISKACIACSLFPSDSTTIKQDTSSPSPAYVHILLIPGHLECVDIQQYCLSQWSYVQTLIHIWGIRQKNPLFRGRI